MSSTLFKKNVTTKIKTSEVSPYKARRLKQAIIDIDSIPIETLCKSGRVLKLNISGQDNLYAYRVGSSTRIVFTTVDGKKIVQDIIDTDTIKRRNHSTKK